MWKITLAVGVALSTLAASNPATPQGRGLRIFEANYGVRGREIEVGRIIAARCEGRYRCEFPVSNEFFGTDPIVGVPKRLVVRWTCGDGRNRSEFPENTEARLFC